MPKETFFNLPEEKRNMIRAVAIKEFATHTYDQASVNRIVANAEISKGSLYQYFEDKKDIFNYLIALMTEEKLKFVSPVMQNPDGYDFFTLIKELYVSGIRFAVENPEYAEIVNRLMETKNSKIYKEIMDENMDAAFKYFDGLIKKAIAKGEVRKEIDHKMFTYLIASMNEKIIEYFSEYVPEDDDEKILETVDNLIDLLKHGMAT